MLSNPRFTEALWFDVRAESESSRSLGIRVCDGILDAVGGTPLVGAATSREPISNASSR
jgi:hypothetical protein